VLFVDEAKTLVDYGFYNAFRWVLDEVVPMSFSLGQTARGEALTKIALPFMAIFLGTNSKVADFLPPGEDSSHRYFNLQMTVPQPFTALDWDINIGARNYGESLTYDSLSEMRWLCRFGRPMWQSQWSLTRNGSSEKKALAADDIIQFAALKLHQCYDKGGFVALFDNATQGLKDKRTLTFSAILGVLAILNLDFASPKWSAELVASRLRWAAGCDPKRTYLLTCYPSEPILAEAASRLLFSEVPGTDHRQQILCTILDTVADHIGKGDYDTGEDGELVARILCISLVYHFSYAL
jgi:hypothetical protein